MSKNILWHDRSSFEVDKKNPWRGLASYDDPQNNNTNYEFCGRDEEAAQIVRLVDNSLFVTLYGRTGVGKTSLLKAGVFPILRLHNYVPLYVRLAHGNKDKSYAEIVLNAIENCDELKEKRHNDAGLINTDGKSITFLWDFFCQTKFFNKEGQEVYPVIVLDQFEEIFVNQSPKEREKANLFLRQIYTLLSDDYILLDKEGFSDETNYRFIASIREDNLFLLEDSIDEESLSQYKEDRYRLRPMSKMQAIEAILQPGKDCIAEDEKEEIANKIIEAAKDKDGTISSLMLSFICSQLYEKAATSSASPLITIKIFNEHLSESKRLLTEFYLQQTSKKQRKIIEEYFLTEDGHRKQCQVPIPNSEDLVNKYKIMQDTKTENGDGLEIVHDKLAEVIYMHRRQTDSKKFRYALCCVVGLIMVALFGLSIILSWSSSMPYDKKSILAINKKPKSYPKTDTLINDRIVDISLKNSDIRNVLIGDNVDSISSISLSEEQRIVVSTKNNMIKSDYIYRCGSYKADTIQYLYYADQPQVAIWAQKYIYYGDSLRFPKGIKEIKIDGSYRRASEYAPYYGEQNIVINTENDFNYVKNDKRIQSVTIRNVSEVPERQFEGCINLTRADLSGDEMKLNSSCFKGCVNLREVILPKKLSGNYSSEEFYGCVNLEKIVLPDQVEYPGGLGQMFQWCPNIKEISYYSENTNFKEHEDGIIYYHSEYDTIPVFFYNCKEANWGEGEKGGYWIVDARVMYNANQINIISNLFSEEAQSNLFVNGNNVGYSLFQKGNDSCLIIPPQSKIIYLDYNPNLKELHSPIADPQVFEFEHPAMDDMSNVTLYVPYGCREAYYESGKFNDYKEIKEDGLMKRVLETVQYYWNGVKWAFGTYSWLLYPIVLFLLVILAFIFYKLKVYQMKKRGIVSKRKAMFKAIEADIAAIIGFVPVYWCTFQIGMNHCEINYKLMCELMLVVWLFFSFFVMRLINDTIKKRIYWPFLLGVVDVLCLICIFYVAKRGDDTKHYVEQCMCLSSFFGGLSGYLCAYLAVFAGNGNILNKMKRWKLST